MRLVPHRPALLLAVIPLALALLACSVGASPTSAPTSTPVAPTATPAPSASVLRVANSQHFADSKSGGTAPPCANGDPLVNGDCGVTVTASCAGGDVALSGGYTLDDPLAFVTSSYPSGAAAWTITAHDEGQDGGSHPVTVTAYAECLHANFAAGVGAVAATPVVPADSNPHEATVNCPAGTIVTGGGFRGTNGTQESIPAANGWTAALSVQLGGTAKPQLFAVCAKDHLAAGGEPKVTADPLLGAGADLAVSCPAATVLAGGGARTVGFGNISTSAANAALTQWQMHVSANAVVGGPPSTYSVADYAVCVKVN